MAKNENAQDAKKTCFIAMPISTSEQFVASYGGDSNHFKHVIDTLLMPAVKKAGFDPIPPSSTGSEIIHAEIIQQLEKADLVLVDMSTLNPNVFFELGIRVALDRPICLIKDDKTVKVPFDTTIINHHVYRSTLFSWNQEEDVNSLATHILASAESKPDKLSLWKIFSMSYRAKPTDSPQDPNRMMELINHRLDGLTELILNQTLVIPKKPERDIVRAICDELLSLSLPVYQVSRGENKIQIMLSTSVPSSQIDNTVRYIREKFGVVAEISVRPE